MPLGTTRIGLNAGHDMDFGWTPPPHLKTFSPRQWLWKCTESLENHVLFALGLFPSLMTAPPGELRKRYMSYSSGGEQSRPVWWGT